MMLLPHRPRVHLQGRAVVRHRTLPILILWILFLAAALVLQAFITISLPLKLIAQLAGAISLSYVGVSKGANIVKAMKAPAGDFGFDYIEPKRDRLLWITWVWIAILAEALIVRAALPETVDVPVETVVAFSGLLSASFVGLGKGEKMAAAGGKEKAE